MENNPSQERSRPRSRRPAGRVNYRLMLCIAVLVCFLLAILFFALMMNQRGKVKTRDEQIATLNGQVQTLTNEKAALQQQMDGLYTTAVAALPDPTTAQTNSLPDLIPQLADGIYAVRSTGDAYQYIKIPDGILTDRLNAFRDADGYTAADGSPSCTYWMLYADRVIGLAEGDTGFVSTDRTAAGAASTVPAGFTAFVASFFA